MNIKGSSAQGQRLIGTYNRNIGYYLSDVYDNYSAAKDKAWDDCQRWFNECNESSNFHICSRNSMQFTVAWAYVDPETQHKMIRVETASRTYIIDTEV